MNATGRAAVRELGALAAALALLGALAGCSPGQPTTAPSAAPPSAPSAPTSAAPSAAPSTPTSAAPTDPSATPPDAPPAPTNVPRVDADISTNQASSPVPPVRVQVDDLAIDMPVIAVGLAADGSMGLDPNPAVAAWYRYGPGPATGHGATVIAAHVDSLVYDIGPFAKLSTAGAGTEVLVTTEEGRTQRYVVESVQLIDKAAVPWDSIFDRTGPARLTLVTCGGEFDRESRRYLGSVILTATPVG